MAACSQKINPEKPKLIAGKSLGDAPISSIGIPLSIEVAEIENALNEALKPVIYEDNDFENNQKDDFKVKLSKLGAASLDMSGNMLRASMPLRVEAELRLIGKKIGKRTLIQETKKVSFEATVRLRSSLALQEDWRIMPNTEIDQITWIKRPTLKVGRLKIPLDMLVEKILRKKETKLEAALDKVIYEKIPLKKQVDKIWLSMQKPILLDKKSQMLWLVNAPQRISAMQPSAENDLLTIRLKLETSLQTVVGKEPPTNMKPLPNLLLARTLPDSFKIYMNCRAFYTGLSEILNKKLDKKEFEKGGAKVRIKDVEIDGGGDILVVGLKLKGDLNGQVYLSGKPTLDSAQKSLTIKDFGFDMHSEEVLLSVGDWLLNSTLIGYVEENVSIPLDSLSYQIPDKIVAGLNKSKLGERLELDFSAFAFKPVSLVMTGAAIEALILAEGKSSLNIKKITKK